jgi:hypothetical protein
MNKKIVPIVIVLLLLTGVGYYLKMKPSSMMGEQSASSAQSEAMQFAEAINSGRPTTCILTKDLDKMEYHIKGKMMSADITSEVNGEITLSHMINDGSYLYTWSDTQNQGVKMAIPSEEETKAAIDKAKEYQQNMPATPRFEGEADYESFKNQGYTINCKASSVGDSVFTPPSDVTFTDPTQMMQQLTMPDGGQIDYKKLQEQYGSMVPAEE